MAIQTPPSPPPQKKVSKQTNNKKKVNAVLNAAFWHSRNFILHLCSSLSSVQMIVTLPVTFFFLKQQLQSGENQIVWTRVGREFQKFEVTFWRRSVSAGREKFFDGKVTQLLNFVAYSVQYASEIKPYGNIKAEALRHKKRKKTCV